MGDLSKVFARELKVEIWDDRNSTIDFTHTDVNMELVNEVKNFQNQGGYLSLWLKQAS